MACTLVCTRAHSCVRTPPEPNGDLALAPPHGDNQYVALIAKTFVGVNPASHSEDVLAALAELQKK